MKKPASRERRLILLINRKFQMSFLLYTIASAWVILAITFGANRYFFWKFAQKGEMLGLRPGHIFFRFLEEQRWTMDLIFLGTALLSSFFLIGYGLYLSNRIAGPLHQLKNYLEAVGNGKNLHPLKFRKNDYFQELAEVTNQCFTQKSSTPIEADREAS